MKNKPWMVVVPTIREEQFNEFLKAWTPLFNDNVDTLYVVEDNPKRSFKMPTKGINFKIEHFSWKEIDADLKKDSWVIPRRTDCIRSYGFYRAYKDSGYSRHRELVLTLDDDVRPFANNIFESYEYVFNKKQNNAPFFNTMDVTFKDYVGDALETYPRGYPFALRNTSKVMLQYGPWMGVPDFDAITQLQNPGTDFKVLTSSAVVPKGVGVTGCIMNCAFRMDIVPFMYQLLMGQDQKGNKHPYDRWGDIWSCHIAKSLLDATQGCVVYNQAAGVSHQRASSVEKNLAKEASGYVINETFWDEASNTAYLAALASDNVESYAEFADALHTFTNVFGKEHTKKYTEAMKTWSKILKR